MGLFGSLKKNFNHGGVKLKLNAPASISAGQGNVLVTLDVTATDSAATINSANIELIQKPTDPANDSGPPEQPISGNQSTQAFSLQPGETKTIQLQLPTNAGAAVADMTQGKAPEAVTKALGMLSQVVQQPDRNRYDYYLRASISIEGIKMNAQTEQPVQLTGLGEVGSGLNLKI